MKKILLLTFLIVSFSCQKNKYYTPEILAEKAFKSLQEDDLKLFKNTLPSFEIVQKVSDMTASEYNIWITETFVESQEEFTQMNLKASDFELFKVNEPHKTYEHDGFEYIRYDVIIKNQEDVYLELKFSDCIKTPDGYKLGEVIRLSAM